MIFNFNYRRNDGSVIQQVIVSSTIIALIIVALVVYSGRDEGVPNPVFSGLSLDKGSSDTSGISAVRIGNQTVKVELADSDPERENGLGGRETIGENEGMLFVFDNEDYYDFWMENMKFAIDIIWINGEMKVVHLKENARPESYPEIFRAEAVSRYVLEVPSGFVRKNGVKIGDAVQFSVQ